MTEVFEMLGTTRLTERDEEIVRCLALYVRLLSQRQASVHWFDGDDSNARRRLSHLQRLELVRKVGVRARTLPPIREPLIKWRPGEATPNCAKAAYVCRSRWRLRHVRSCTAYIATEKAAQLFGGRRRGEIAKDLQVTHDLGVTQVWLLLDETLPNWADAWRGEDVMAATRYRQKLPDGFIVDANATPICVMEFGGSYDEQRVSEFHQDCAGRGLPYQLW